MTLSEFVNRVIHQNSYCWEEIKYISCVEQSEFKFFDSASTLETEEIS
jgi:hypothetical protein